MVIHHNDGTMEQAAPASHKHPGLVCGVCLYDDSGDVAEPAVTVIEGYAVCEDHLGYVARGVRFAEIVRIARSWQ